MLKNHYVQVLARPWPIASVLALAVTAASWGQVLQEREGRALDANTMVGSGGSNTPIRGYVPINGNQVMTGNVSGLGYFHGRVPYSSSTEFQGRLGSSDLRTFARQSGGLSSGGTYTGGYSTYYMPSQLTSTSQGRINPGSLTGVEARMTGPGAINPTSSARTQFSAGPSKMVDAPNAGDPVVPLRSFRVNGGSSDNLTGNTTSSLFGWRSVREDGQALSVDLSAGATPIKTSARAGDDQFNTQPGNQGNTNNADGKTPADNTPVGVGRTGTQDDGRVKPLTLTPADGTKSDRYLDGSLKPNKDNKGSESDANSAKIKTAGATPLLTDSPAVAKAKTELAKYQSTDPSAPNYRSKQWLDNKLHEIQAQAYETAAPGADTKTVKRDAYGKVIADGSADTTRAPRMSGREPISPRDMMNIADRQMKAGRYIQAADTYQSVLLLDAGYTPAMIGRAQAEIAAGFYESAAYDLRFVFDRYPDLLTLKTDLRRMMGDRLNFVITDLAALAQRTPKGPANFLLTYCYYQTGQADKLQEQLKSWAQASPNDLTQKSAAKIWGDGGDNKATPPN